MANQRALPPSLLWSSDSNLVARKEVFGLLFKATKCVVGQVICVFPCVPFERVFRLVWLTIKEMTDSTQLIVIQVRSTMVLSISRTLYSVSNNDSDTDCRNWSHAQRRRFVPLTHQNTVLH